MVHVKRREKLEMGYFYLGEVVANNTSTVNAVLKQILTWSTIHTPARSPATGHATARTTIPVCVRLQKEVERNENASVREVRYCRSIRMEPCDTVGGAYQKYPYYDETTLYSAKCVVPSLASWHLDTHQN